MALSDYLPIALLLGLSTLFGAASIWVASKVGPHNPNPTKLEPYECGIVPERLPRERFPIKFYLVAMLFIIFDVEVIFFYPFAVILRELRLFGLVEMGVFVALLLVAYVYLWRGGAFDWEEEAPSARRAVSDRLMAQARAAERIGA
ncbi:MAG TPA: NADH-quinone oxidoreductase subunit A [Actinomycetota bacterium]